jgi:hypothetical protein
MTGHTVRALITATLLALCGSAQADEPLSMPRPLPAPSASYFPAKAYYRRSAYEVWQAYGVDRRGFFRPVVVYSPIEPYYLYNSAPFPWALNHPREFMPYVVD